MSGRSLQSAKYFPNVDRSSDSVSLASCVILLRQEADCQHTHFLYSIGGISEIYILNRTGASTDPCGSPFLRSDFTLISIGNDLKTSVAKHVVM